MRKVAIVGNGSIGMLTAILVKETFPFIELTLYGDISRRHAASTAAGAMANVYGEIESASEQITNVHPRYLEMGKQGSSHWLEFLHRTNGIHCRTAEDTFVYLRKNSSEFEKANYLAMRDFAMHDGIGSDLTKSEIESSFPLKAVDKVEHVTKLRGEYSLSTDSLFLHLDSLADKLGIKRNHQLVQSIDHAKKIVVLDGGNFEGFDRIIVCAGARTQKLFSKDSNVLTMFQGVGVALVIRPFKSLSIDRLRKGVFRSVNRGGAQCGVHLVPRTDGGIYVGAGNYVSQIESPQIRMDSVRYLLHTLENDLLTRNEIYDFMGEFVVGLRPRSIDGFPMIGPLKVNQDIFIATATNRAGLTWAPFLARQAISWLRKELLSEIVRGWEPDRLPIRFGTPNAAIDYFVQSRIANAQEHGLITSDEIESKSIEFRLTAEKLHKAVSARLELASDFSINPDNWGALLAD